MRPRTIVNGFGVAHPVRLTNMVTGSPTFPRSKETASSKSMLTVLVFSIRTILSSAFSPSSQAGVPSMGCLTVNCPS